MNNYLVFLASVITPLSRGVLILLLLFGSDWGFGQAFNKKEYSSRRLQGSLGNSRGSYSRFSKGQDQGNEQFRQIAMMDGNLCTGPFTNSGVISHGGIGQDIRIGWPKGPNRSDYVWGAFFFVGAKVEDANGNILRIISDNIPGEQANDGSHEYAFMPLPKYYNLDIPGSLSEILIGGVSEDVGPDGVPGSGDQGEGDGKLQPGEDFNGNGELDLSMQNGVGWFAISNRRETWPEYWPPGSYPGDDRQPGEERPGVRAGRWNGEFGAYLRADQEIYYVMDDRENDEFNYFPFDSIQGGWPDGRRGLGIKVESRTYQWNSRLAEDIMICLYDITKYKDAKDLPIAVVGMYVDPDLGGPPTNDDGFFDEQDDITYTWNKLFLSEDGLPLGYFGFAFLESPGLGYDGIDNDQDGLPPDERQDDGIDNDGDWVMWFDSNGNGIFDNEDLNYNGVLDPGEDANQNGKLDIEDLLDDVGSDGLGPDNFEYTGPDPNGTEANGIPDLGEPNFEFTDNDESDQIGLTSFFLRSTQDPNLYGGRNDEYYFTTEVLPRVDPVTGEVDGQIIAGFQQDVSFSYGSGYVKFDSLEGTQSYAIAMVFGNDFDDILRNKKTIQVIYDNDYNFSKPPRQPVVEATAADKRVFLRWDTGAERSRDPIYGLDFEAYYVYKSVDPTFYEIKTISDGFGNPFLFKPLAIFDLDNGLKGLHPVSIGSELGPESDLGVTYNMGTDSGLQHNFIDDDVINGRTYFYAIASVDRGYIPEFFPDISDRENLQIISPTECAVNIQIDPLGRPISFDPNTVQVIPSEISAGYVQPSLSETGIEHVAGQGSGSIDVEIYNPMIIKTGHRYRVEFDDDGRYEQFGPGYLTGVVNKMFISSVTENISLNIVDEPQNNNFSEQFITDGFRVILHADTNWVDSTATGWIEGNTTLEMSLETIPNSNTTIARNYEIRIMPANADTSIINRPANFQIWDVTNPDSNFKMLFFHIDNLPVIGELDEKDVVSVVDKRPPGFTNLWRFRFNYTAGVDTIRPEPGDVFKFTTIKTFDRNDAFEFTLVGNDFNAQKAKNDLDKIFAVPDPYIAVNNIERKVINEEEGRGERRIDFVNLPRDCNIKIFTVSGRLVRRLEHHATQKNRRATWDLRTKDGLEIAHGMYFYVVDAPGIGQKRGKFAVIK